MNLIPTVFLNHHIIPLNSPCGGVSTEDLLESIEYAVCLDGVLGGGELYLHVSKLPTANTAAHAFVQALVRAAQASSHPISLTVVPRKINVAVTQRRSDRRVCLPCVFGFLNQHALAC